MASRRLALGSLVRAKKKIEADASGEYRRVFCDQGGTEVYRLLAVVAGFLAPLGSSGAIFAAIDIAARPGVQFHHGLGGKFNAGRGNSAHSEKATSYPY